MLSAWMLCVLGRGRGAPVGAVQRALERQQQRRLRARRGAQRQRERVRAACCACAAAAPQRHVRHRCRQRRHAGRWRNGKRSEQLASHSRGSEAACAEHDGRVSARARTSAGPRAAAHRRPAAPRCAPPPRRPPPAIRPSGSCASGQQRQGISYTTARKAQHSWAPARQRFGSAGLVAPAQGGQRVERGAVSEVREERAAGEARGGRRAHAQALSEGRQPLRRRHGALGAARAPMPRQHEAPLMRRADTLAALAGLQTGSERVSV